MIAQYISTRPIMDFCNRLVQRPGAWVYLRWWEQEGIDLSGVRERAAAAADREAERIVEEAAQEETMVRSRRQRVQCSTSNTI